jgi:hypothetical protein
MSGLKVLQARPSAGLKNVVRCFQERVGDVGRQPVFLPLPARAEQFLEFYFSDPYRIRERASGEVSRAPGAVIVGAQTFRRADLLLQGELRLFTIQFTPTGLHALFGVRPTNSPTRPSRWRRCWARRAGSCATGWGRPPGSRSGCGWRRLGWGRALQPAVATPCHWPRGS